MDGRRSTNAGPNPVTDATITATAPHQRPLQHHLDVRGRRRRELRRRLGHRPAEHDGRPADRQEASRTRCRATSTRRRTPRSCASPPPTRPARTRASSTRPTTPPTDTTYLTPLLNGAQPTFTLAANGTATVTSNGTSWLGGSIGYTRQWQRCDVDGTNCVDIASATGTTYSTQAADKGKTLRLKVNATNAAGTTRRLQRRVQRDPGHDDHVRPGHAVGHDQRGASRSARPAAPAARRSSARSTAPPTAPARTPRNLTGLAAGSHTFNVRATYGGLVDPTPATHTWTVDLDAELTVTGPLAGETATNLPTVTGTGEPGSTVTIKVDGVVVATGVVGAGRHVRAPAARPSSTTATRTIKVSVVDPVGNVKDADGPAAGRRDVARRAEGPEPARPPRAARPTRRSRSTASPARRTSARSTAARGRSAARR